MAASAGTLRPPSPLVASYSDWSRASPLPIQTRYEPLPNYVPKRTYQTSQVSPYTHEVRRPINRYSLGEVVVMDTCQRPATATPASKSHREKACKAVRLGKKAELTREGSKKGGVEGRCEQWARPMTPKGMWLYRDLKPEDHFTGKRDIKPVRKSTQIEALQEFIEERKSPKAAAAIPAITEYISTEGKDVIAVINAAIGSPKTENPPNIPIPQSQIGPEEEIAEKTEPIAEENEPIESLESRIEALKTKAAELHANLAKKSEYQAEFTAANSLNGRVKDFKPVVSRVKYFL